MDTASSRFVERAVRYFSNVAGASAVDTHAGVLLEHLPFTNDTLLPTSIHTTFSGGNADPAWLNYAERDAYRSMAEAAMVLPAASPIRVHIPWTGA